MLWRKQETKEQLHAWIRMFLRINVPTVGVCRGHDAPFEYLWHAYAEPAKDVVVWAPRGGGKTRLAAAATLLDLLHKPGCGVRILGGSLEQSLRMWEHLLPDLERLADGKMKDGGTARRVKLENGAAAAVLAQSQRSVRGVRVQKLRCDEVDLFEPEVWEAAQLVTRSAEGAAGVIEAMSTYHQAFGVMKKVVGEAKEKQIRVIKWCLMEVLERCGEERRCEGCELWSDCGGVAKTKCAGFVSIDDAIAMKRRVSLETWESEMMCRRPSVKGVVFPMFEEQIHVREGSGFGVQGSGEKSGAEQKKVESGKESMGMTLAIDFGFSNSFVCLWVEEGGGGVVRVVDEYVQEQRTVEEHLREMEGRGWGKVRRVACDPAGNGRNDQTAESNVQLLRRRGYSVHTRKSLIQEGLEMIRAGLRPGAGEGTLFVHPRCRRLIAALRGYRYGKGSEVPIKDGEHDHLIDALRYFYVNREGGRVVTGRAY